MNKKKLHDLITGYGFAAPATLLLLVFTLIPIVMAVYLSMTEFNGFGDPIWIGLANYKEAFQDLAIQASIRNTLIYVLIAMPLQIGISLMVAALLAAKFRNRFGEFVRGTLFIPVICSLTLIGTVFSYIFASDAGSVANQIVMALGFDKQNWLGSESSALGVIIAVNSWKNIGYYVVILYAGIMDIPNDLYEASSIDGANKLQQFFRITIPNLKSVLFMVITVCTIWSLQIFDLPYTMTAGGPGYATTTLAYQLYLRGFKSLNFGYANAIGVILFVLVLLVNAVQRVFMKED